MIRFMCPSCQQHLQVPDHGAGQKVPCPRCGQKLKIPHVPKTTGQTLLGLPLPGAPSSPTQLLDDTKLDQLNRFQTVTLPGTVLAYIGLPLVFIVPIILGCILIPSRISRMREDGVLSVVLTLGVLSILWGVSLVVVLESQYRVNRSFRRRNAIHLHYSNQSHLLICYKRVLEYLDGLASTTLFEIVPWRGSYEHTQPVYLCAEFPDYIECNCRVYCLGIFPKRFYLLPDCVLVFAGGSYATVPYRNVSLAINNVVGYFTTTERDVYAKHVRIDGRPDRRYKDNFEVRSARVTKPIDEYGVITLKIGMDAFIILTEGDGLLPKFDVLFHEWMSSQV
jgi:hypothetical protein